MFSVSLLFPPYWDLALGSFFFCWAYPGKIWGKENEKSNQYSCYVHVMYLLLLFLEIIPAILTTIRNNVMCTPYSMHYFRLYSAIGSTFITTTYRRNRRNSQKKKKEKKRGVSGCIITGSLSWDYDATCEHLISIRAKIGWTNPGLKALLFFFPSIFLFYLSVFAFFSFLSNCLISLQLTLSVTA